MRGTLRKKKLKSGKISLYIDYYPPVWNSQTKQYTRREFLKLDLNVIYTKCGDGQIPYFKMGKLYKFKKSEILEWVKKQDASSPFSVDDYVERYLQKNQLKG